MVRLVDGDWGGVCLVWSVGECVCLCGGVGPPIRHTGPTHPIQYELNDAPGLMVLGTAQSQVCAPSLSVRMAPMVVVAMPGHTCI